MCGRRFLVVLSRCLDYTFSSSAQSLSIPHFTTVPHHPVFLPKRQSLGSLNSQLAVASPLEIMYLKQLLLVLAIALNAMSEPLLGLALPVPANTDPTAPLFNLLLSKPVPPGDCCCGAVRDTCVNYNAATNACVARFLCRLSFPVHRDSLSQPGF